MKPTTREDRGYNKASFLKAGGLAAALGAITWLLVPYLLPVKPPADFPKLPDLATATPGLRAEIEDADRKARRRPGSAEAMGKLGMVYHANLLFEQAESAYRIAARLAPGDYQWAYGRALVAEETGNEQEQVKLLQQAVRLKAGYVPALIKLADGFFKVDRLDEAARYYELAAKAPDSSAFLPASFGLARVAARRNDWNKVIEYVVPLSRKYPYVRACYESLQEAYLALGQADKAAEAQQGMAQATWKIVPPPEDPFDGQLTNLSYSSTRLLKQAGLLSRVGSPDRAMLIARRAAQVDPTDPGVRNFIAYTLVTFYGDKPEAVEEALQQLSECLRLNPNDLGPLWSFTNEFFRTPKTAAAIERLNSLLRPHAHRPDAYYSLGQVADARGDIPEAVSRYQAALKYNPNDSAVYNKLGQIYIRTGKIDLAIAHFQKSIRLSPTNTGARLNLGVALMQRGSYSEAVKELGELLRLDPHDAAAHFCMGYSLLYSKRIDEAVAQFREGLRYQPDDAEARYGLGSAFAAQRRRDEAVAELREALRLRPGFPPAQELLRQLER